MNLVCVWDHPRSPYAIFPLIAKEKGQPGRAAELPQYELLDDNFERTELGAAGRKFNDVCGGSFWRGLCCSLLTARYGDARRSRLARAKNSSPPASPN